MLPPCRVGPCPTLVCLHFIIIFHIPANGHSSPTNKNELFNLRHASARNIIKHIFGVLKWCFKILLYPPEIDMALQAHLPAALAALHNFIHDLDPLNLNDFQEAVDIELGW